MINPTAYLLGSSFLPAIITIGGANVREFFSFDDFTYQTGESFASNGFLAPLPSTRASRHALKRWRSDPLMRWLGIGTVISSVLAR